MAKPKSVSIAQIEEMKQLIVQGIPPNKISEKFNISPSTVHNYKNKFRSEGLEFADIKGGRIANPKPVILTQQDKVFNQPSSTLAHSNVPSANNVAGAVPSSQLISNTNSAQKNTFIVNGTAIRINTEVKSISIDKTDGNLLFDITI